MPLLLDDRPLIARLRVVDRAQDETTICQLATMRSFNCTQAASGAFSVDIEVWVTQHSVKDGQPGAELAGSPGRALRFSGNNLTLVDDATGAELAVRTTETNEQWAAVVASFSQNTRLQGDFFLRLMLGGPVDISQLILYHMQRANDPALNRYA